MTRKCVLCKETNYRNTYSFFSAPKDPELRKKWQNAIGIENYCVTDDTYVCSKHFHKEDIITHWISGVPPHVISIKYKKCRLRPGAVPGRNYHLEGNTQSQEHSDDSDTNTNCYPSLKLERTSGSTKKGPNFLIPRTEEKLQINYDKDHENSSVYQTHKFVDYSYTSKRNVQNDIEFSKSGSSLNNISYDDDDDDPRIDDDDPRIDDDDPRINDSLEENSDQTNPVKTEYIKDKSFSDGTDLTRNENETERQNEICQEDSYSDVPNRALDSSFKGCNISNENDSLTMKHRIKRDSVSKEKSMDNNFNATEDIYTENHVINNSSNDQLDMNYSVYSDTDKNEMLFEDLLEICTEVLLPRGWSCLVTSKGRTTTIVYLYMGMTKNGMPFAEKQVFIKSDMTLHCAVVNKEIDPLIHNLVREGKHLKVQNLIDIEELIDEFDQRIVCQGIHDTERFQEINYIKQAYKDGVKWRHSLCPLLVNNDLSRCTRCISLSDRLQHKTKSFFSFPYKRSIFTRKHTKVHSLRQKCKRVRKQDHKYEFVKMFKQ